MITPINQAQPQFKARLYSGDISVLANEAKRTTDPKAAMNELFALLSAMKAMPEREAKLMYKTELPASKFNLILDGKKAGGSAISFTEALKNLFTKRMLSVEEYSKKMKNNSPIGFDNLKKFAIDA